MGSDQSTAAGSSKSTSRPRQLVRGHTIASSHLLVSEGGRPNDLMQSGNNSPGASVCSDTELPYISYTVNRPIGDSPKLTAKTGTSIQSSSSRQSSESKRSTASMQIQKRQMSAPARSKPAGKAHHIVVVKEGRVGPSIDADEEVRRLQQIPMFLPIMRGTLGLPGARDPEVLEGLDYRPWVRLAARYQAHLAACAQPVVAEQAALTLRVKETDAEMSRLTALAVERQKMNARDAEKLSRARDLSHQLNKCHDVLNHALQTIDDLNNLLPVLQRLEPFVWTTG